MVMGDDYCQKVVGSNPGAVYFNTFFANIISERLNFVKSLRNFDWFIWSVLTTAALCRYSFSSIK